MKSKSCIPLLLFAALLATGCSSMTITPTGTRIISTVDLEEVNDFQFAQMSGGSYVVFRSAPYRDGHVMEGFDANLARTWTLGLPFVNGYPIRALWLTTTTSGATLVYSRRERDSISIRGMIIDPASGAVVAERRLTSYRYPDRFPEFGGPMLVASPDSSRFAVYRYHGYRKHGDSGSSVVIAVRAELFDSELNKLGGTSLEIPVPDAVNDAEDAEPYVQSFFLANDGRAYQASCHGASTLRVTQLDFVTGTSRMLEHALPDFDLNDRGRQTYRMSAWTGAGQQVVVAATHVDDGDLKSVALVEMNFSRNHVEYVTMVHVTEMLAEKLMGKDELRGFSPREIIRTSTGESILPFEQRSTYPRSNGFPDVDIDYFHDDVMIMGFNATGRSIWFITQKRPRVKTIFEDFRSEAWRVEQDSVRFIYRDKEVEGIAFGAISNSSGALSPPRLLMQTSMTLQSRYTRWLGSNEALIILSRGKDFRLVRFSW